MSVSAAQPVASARPAPSLRTNSLAEGVFILFALTIVQRLIGFLRGVLFCRWLDAEQLGQWDLAFSFLVFLSPLAVLGLPGSFGRYVETYRQQGQLRTFLRRTSWASLLPATLFCLAAACFAPQVAELLFGSREQASLTSAMAAALAGFIAWNYLVSLFTALRATRIVSHLQFFNAVLFAGASLYLLAERDATAASAVYGFGFACIATAALAGVSLVRLWRELPSDEPPLAHAALWGKLVPFAFWVWVTNWLTNAFELADRYLLVHWSGLSHDESLALVGQYHSARVIPMLFLGLADLLSTLVTPHLAHDWEAGRREQVASRLRLVLKLFGLSFTGAAIGLMIGSPLFFHTALEDKFGFGQTIFPFTLACAVWTGLAWISHNWLWCAERSRLVCIGLSVGLATSVGLNLVLLPRFGLEGVVWAAAVAKVTTLAVVWSLCRMLSMRIDRGLALVAMLPVLLLVGPWWALAGIVIAAVGIVPACGIFDADERRQLGEAGRKLLARVHR
jgi:O-antigen/teichoic acid export membrane protein